MDDVVLNKAALIERCVARVHEEHAGDDRNITDNVTKQDAIVLNIQRACEAAIDLGMHLVRRYRLGIPQDSRDAFELLAAATHITREQATALQRMVGFRNVAVHDYRKLNLDMVKRIVATHLDDLQGFGQHAVRTFG